MSSRSVMKSEFKSTVHTSAPKYEPICWLSIS
uniref:Uncharacterized protein n=1 Tax=Anguilla anguilla TaxID=7936 RepID=A0A0E9TGR0_ANGAN